MTRLIKDSSLFAVYDPDAGRENLYQYSGEQLFADVSFTIENELNDYLTVTNVEQNLAFPGGRLDLVGNEFIYTPAYQHIYGTDDIVLVADYNDYAGNRVLEGGTDKQYNWNQYFSEQININTTFRVAQEVSVNTNGITYDDPTDPTYIVQAEADRFITLNHDVDILLENIATNAPRSEASTVNDLLKVREFFDVQLGDINQNIDNITDFIRQTENIEEGGLYHLVKATGADTEPGRSQFDPNEAAVAPEVVFFFPGADQEWSDTVKVRIHQNFLRTYDDNGDPVEGTYNYKRFITGGYIRFDPSGGDDEIIYSITGHISDGGDPDGSQSQPIGATGEDYFEFEVSLVSGPAGDMLEETYLYRVTLYSLETGINIEQADARYVNVTGDKVFGTLEFEGSAAPITVTDDSGDIHLRIAANGVISQPDIHDNLVDDMLVNRKNIKDAIAAESVVIDGKYVKVTGDKMSGKLTIDLPRPNTNSNSFVIKGFVDDGNGNLVEGMLLKDYRREDSSTSPDYMEYHGQISSDNSLVNKKYVDNKVSTSVQGTDLNTEYTGTTVKVTSSTGDDATIDGATKDEAGVITTASQEFSGRKKFPDGINVGNDLGNYGIILSTKFSANGSVGVNGYVLTSRGDDGPCEWTPSNAEPGVPVGLIAFWGHKAPVPDGWLILDGSSYDTTKYANLHALLSQTQGYVNGKLPDYRDKFVCAIGGAGGVNTGAPGQMLTELTKRPVTAFELNTSSHNHTFTASETSGHTHSVKTFTSAGAHKHYMGTSGHRPNGTTTNSDNFRARNTGTNGNEYTDEQGAHTHSVTLNSHKVTVSGTVTNSGSHSHTFKTSSGGDATTRPKTVLGYWIIQT